MKSKIDMGARIILGLMMVVFGFNFFFQFLPMPPPAESMMKFMMALIETGYLMKIVKVIEIVAGLMLLANMFVPLALLLLAPIVVNIFLVHTFLDMSGLPVGIACVVLLASIAWARWEKFSPLLSAK